MRIILPYILTMMSLLTLSCSKIKDYADNQNDRFIIINGSVTDNTGSSIEHIRITVETELLDESLMIYTSSKGFFHCEIPYVEIKQQLTISLLFDDIDGEDNAGLFESRSDNIRIFPKDYKSEPIIIDLKPYRLNRATASENSRQF